MNTATRLAGFGLGLVAVLAAGFGLGRAVGPVGPGAPPAVHQPADHPVPEDGAVHDGAVHGG